MDYKKVHYKGEKRIFIDFDYDEDKIEKIKTITGRKWSATLKCWHVPDNEDSLKKN